MSALFSVEELYHKVQHPNSYEVLLDVRTAEEFAAGHLPGALHIDANNPDFTDYIQQLDPSKTYIVYCRSGGRSQIAATLMRQYRLTVINALPGFLHWQLAGYPVSFEYAQHNQ